MRHSAPLGIKHGAPPDSAAIRALRRASAGQTPAALLAAPFEHRTPAPRLRPLQEAVLALAPHVAGLVLALDRKDGRRACMHEARLSVGSRVGSGGTALRTCPRRENSKRRFRAPHGEESVADRHGRGGHRGNWMHAPLRRREGRRRGSAGHPCAQRPVRVQSAHGRAQHPLCAGHGLRKSVAAAANPRTHCFPYTREGGNHVAPRTSLRPLRASPRTDTPARLRGSTGAPGWAPSCPGRSGPT